MAPFIKRLRSARARGVPLIGIRTSDQPATLVAVAESTDLPVIAHDVVRGFSAANEAGKSFLDSFLEGTDPVLYTDPTTALEGLAKITDRVCFVMLGADRWLSEPRPALAALLLRDRFARQGCALVCIGTAMACASELGSDLYVIDCPVPDSSERESIVKETVAAAGIECSEATIRSAVSFTRGLSGFACQQTVALAMTKEGLDTDTLQSVWREAINAVPGLRVESPDDRDPVAGLAEILAYVDTLKGAKEPFESVVFVDEIEKSFAGASGDVQDSSGSSQAVLQRMLTQMEDSKARGFIAAGPPGTGKSLAARAIARRLGVPLISLDLGSMKGSLVGETERKSREAFAALRALAGKALFIATCNRLESDDKRPMLPPELMRRFTSGVWFFDLPEASEREAIWTAQLKAHGLESSERWAEDAGWTGADIRNVVREAADLGLPVASIARRYVPSSRASAATIDRVRKAAAGCYFSASYAGAYRYPTAEVTATTTARKFDFSGVKES